jgi:hypothetical protein
MDFNNLVIKMRRSLLALLILLIFDSVYGQTEKEEYFVFIGEKISVSIKQTGSIKIDTTVSIRPATYCKSKKFSQAGDTGLRVGIF